MKRQMLRSLHQMRTSGMASIVETRRLCQGEIVGQVGALPNGKPYYGYKGIPYAQPPIGDLRFKSPIPLQCFPQTPLDCREEREVSFHKDALSATIVGSENCLFLNVYGPKECSDKPLPVMVYVHGGGFLFGSGNSDMFGPLYLVQEGVIVVTINYRLGVFGFLAYPEANIPGNAGLKDQLMALKWVRENIGEFNGDPDNITLFGESAGSASVHLHMYSENSKKLFHKAILQSGTANMQWVVQRNPSYKARQLATLLGCKTTADEEIADFLKATDKKIEILKHLFKVLTADERRRDLPMPFKPVVETGDSPDAVLTKEPYEAMLVKDSVDIPVMMGYNSNEGIVMLVNALARLKEIDQDLERLIPRSVNIDIDDPVGQKLADEIRNFYFRGKRIDRSVLEELAALFGDYHFGIGIHMAAEIHSQRQTNSPLYFYRFGFNGALNMYKKWFQLEHISGACHADELFYLFQMGLNENPLVKGSSEEMMIRRMSKLWTNFAKFGNPTPPDGDNGDVIDFEWKPVRKVAESQKFSLDYLDIDEKTEMKVNPDEERIRFWRNVFRTWNKDFLKPKL